MNEIEYRRMRDCEDRHWWYATLHELVLHFVDREFRTRGPLKIYDAGCGTGGLLAKLARFGSVGGCDHSPHALALCRARGLRNVEQQDLNELVLAPASFDVITLADVLCHEWIRSEDEVLARLYAALKPGGLLIVNDPACEWLRSTHDRAVLSSRRYTRGRVRALLERAGFRVEKLTCRMFLLLAPIAAYRLAKRRGARAGGTAAPASDVWMPPPWINALLRLSGAIENALLAGINLPAGTSVFAVARKPA